MKYALNVLLAVGYNKRGWHRMDATCGVEYDLPSQYSARDNTRLPADHYVKGRVTNCRMWLSLNFCMWGISRLVNCNMHRSRYIYDILLQTIY